MASHCTRSTATPAAQRTSDDCELVLKGPSTYDTVDRLTDCVYEYLATTAMSDHARFQLRMALHEALDNAIEHGNQGDPAKQVTVTCCCRERRVVLTVDDEGDGFDFQTVPDPTTPENLLKESGRGIFLIERCADEYRFENNGRRVVIVKSFT
jgi:serine/threonine-protein kinase RsbW